MNKMKKTKEEPKKIKKDQSRQDLINMLVTTDARISNEINLAFNSGLMPVEIIGVLEIIKMKILLNVSHSTNLNLQPSNQIITPKERPDYMG